MDPTAEAQSKVVVEEETQSEEEEEDFEVLSATETKEELALDDAISSLKNEQDKKTEVIEELTILRNEFHDWTTIREATIAHLREIADYIDSVRRKSGLAKVLGSGGGAVGGGLTLIGGILTIMSAGAALPVLLVGTGIGLASGVTGGAAAVTEKVIKSRQMKEAEQALARDEEATKHLQERVVRLQESQTVREVTKDLLKSGASVTSDSIAIASLVSSGGGIGGLGKIGGEAMARIFGEDMGREISKLFLSTSGRLLTGSFSVVLGGVTMFYDIYRVNREMGDIAKRGEEGAGEMRAIANELEESLLQLVSSSVQPSERQAVINDTNSS